MILRKFSNIKKITFNEINSLNSTNTLKRKFSSYNNDTRYSSNNIYSKYDQNRGNKQRYDTINRNSQNPYAPTTDKILQTLKMYNLPYKVRSSGQITTKVCPFCTKDHKNQPDNFYTLNFKPNDGAFLCFRCGSYGSWYDFSRFMLGDEVNFEKSHDHMGEYSQSLNNLQNSKTENFISTEQRNWYSEGNQTPHDPSIIEKTRYVLEECTQAYNNLLEIEEILIRDEKLANLDPHNPRLQMLASAAQYLIGTKKSSYRHLSLETLKKFKIGIGEEAFKDEDGKLKRIPVIFFPFFRKVHTKKLKNEEDISPLSDNSYEAVKVKLRGSGKEYKKFQRFKPAGGHFGVFGLNTIKEDSKAVVITEGEFDAMAVHQATSLPAVSLPNGASHLPVQLIKMLENLDRIYLWMDNDQIGQINVENFAKKLGEKRTYIVRIDPQEEAKDANDLLRLGESGIILIRDYIMKAKSLPSKDIIKFENIRELVKDRILNLKNNSGIQSNYFPWFNKLIKGFRRGELTIFTGPTGSGKTTFLSQLSMDFSKSGLPTLWCSFELKNEVLLSSMLSQYSGTDLTQNPEKFDYFADRFEQMPMYFQTYFGSTEADRVISMIEYSIYAYDIGHVVIDNLQFMLSGQGRGFERYELQDDVISKFRNLATTCNVHITLVIHPRKGEDNVDLSLHSVFGTAKSTQEADNVLILQHRPKYTVIDVKKNRFDGEIGKVSLWFDRSTKRFEQMGTKEIEALIGGRDVSEVLEERKSRIPNEVKQKELEINDYNHLSTPRNAGLLGHTGRIEDLSDYSKNAVSGGIGVGSMEARLNQEILELFDSENIQSEDFNFSKTQDINQTKDIHQKSTLTRDNFSKREQEGILQSIIQGANIYEENIDDIIPKSYSNQLKDIKLNINSFHENEENNEYSTQEDNLLGEFDFIERMLEEVGLNPDLSIDEQTQKKSDDKIKINNESLSNKQNEIEELKDKLFEPKIETETTFSSNLDSTLKELNIPNSNNAKNKSQSPFSIPMSQKPPSKASINKLQGFNQRNNIDNVDTMYGEGDETLFTFGDIIDELTENNKQTYKNKQEIDLIDPYAPNNKRKKIVDRKTFESRNSLDLSMNYDLDEK